jgi:acetolactate decarboxylase
MWKAPCVSLLVVAFALPWPLVVEAEDHGRDTLHQISTLAALMEGDYDGRATFRELRPLGGFGLGTFDRLDGEMVAVDGKFFRVRADGSISRVHPLETTPFAAVTHFQPDQAFRLEGRRSCSALNDVILSHFVSDELVYAIKVTGEFSLLVTRSVPPQEKPYVPLEDALQDEVVFHLSYVDARMVGFWVPPALGGVNAREFHFHALTNDGTAGGHVHDCEALSVTVEIDTTDRLEVRLGSAGRRGR